MSKIGRKPILFSSAKIQVSGNSLTITGAKTKFVHELPNTLVATLKDKNLVVSLAKDEKMSKENKDQAINTLKNAQEIAMQMFSSLYLSGTAERLFKEINIKIDVK